MEKYQKAIDDWVQGYKEPYWPNLSIFAHIAEEVGEVGRILNHMYGSKPKKETEKDQDLGEEIADVIFALICLANSNKINLDSELEKVIEKSKKRDDNRFAKK